MVLVKLPTEVLAGIFTNLQRNHVDGLRDLCRVRLICKRFEAVVNDQFWSLVRVEVGHGAIYKVSRGLIVCPSFFYKLRNLHVSGSCGAGHICLSHIDTWLRKMPSVDDITIDNFVCCCSIPKNKAQSVVHPLQKLHAFAMSFNVPVTNMRLFVPTLRHLLAFMSHVKHLRLLSTKILNWYYLDIWPALPQPVTLSNLTQLSKLDPLSIVDPSQTFLNVLSPKSFYAIDTLFVRSFYWATTDIIENLQRSLARLALLDQDLVKSPHETCSTLSLFEGSQTLWQLSVYGSVSLNNVPALLLWIPPSVEELIVNCGEGKDNFVPLRFVDYNATLKDKMLKRLILLKRGDLLESLMELDRAVFQTFRAHLEKSGIKVLELESSAFV